MSPPDLRFGPGKSRCRNALPANSRGARTANCHPANREFNQPNRELARCRKPVVDA